MNPTSSSSMFYRYEKGESEGMEIEAKPRTGKKIYYTPEQVKAFNLEDQGIPLNAGTGHKTIIENYLLDFWQPILGLTATMIFINYSRLAMGDGGEMKVRSMGDVADLMGVSRPTLTKYVTLLEEYGFLMRFWAESTKKPGLNDPTWMKVRRTIPLLSEDLVLELPDYLRIEHNKFIKRLSESYNLRLEEDYEEAKLVHVIQKKGSEKRPSREVIASDKEEQKRILNEKMKKERSTEEESLWKEIADQIRQEIPEMSYRTWFGEVFMLMRGKSVLVICRNEIVKEWIENNYMRQVENAVARVFGESREVFLEVTERVVI